MTLVTIVQERTAGTVPDTCLHEDLEYLGAGGPAEYYRCRACGASIIASRGRLWRLRRPASVGRPVG